MLFFVRGFPEAGTEAHQHEQLARLVAHVGMITIYAIRVGENAGVYIEVPDIIAQMVEQRVLPAIVGVENCVEPRLHWVRRADWTVHALLAPTKQAQLLDIGLLDHARCACLTMHWDKQRVAGELWASADDVALLETITKAGWKVRVVSGTWDTLASRLHRPQRTTLQPLLAHRAPAVTAPRPRVPVATMLDDQGRGRLRDAQGREPPPFLADAHTAGLPLGADMQGNIVALGFRPQQLALDVPTDVLNQLIPLLVERAFALEAGVCALVPRSVADALRRSPLRERLRWLDGTDPFESAAIPWRDLPTEALDAALGAVGVVPSGSAGKAHAFAAVLQQRGAGVLASDAVRSLTAPPGDDLRGVVEAGGGVVLVDEGDIDSQVLGALLMQLLGALPPLDRPLVLVRPAGSSIPVTLAAQSLDIAIGVSLEAHSTLTRTADGWLLTSADGLWQQPLADDLRAINPSLGASDNAALLRALQPSEKRAHAVPDAAADEAAWSVAETTDVARADENDAHGLTERVVGQQEDTAAVAAPVDAPVASAVPTVSTLFNGVGFSWDSFGDDLRSAVDGNDEAIALPATVFPATDARTHEPEQESEVRADEQPVDRSLEVVATDMTDRVADEQAVDREPEGLAVEVRTDEQAVGDDQVMRGWYDAQSVGDLAGHALADEPTEQEPDELPTGTLVDDQMPDFMDAYLVDTATHTVPSTEDDVLAPLEGWEVGLDLSVDGTAVTPTPSRGAYRPARRRARWYARTSSVTARTARPSQEPDEQPDETSDDTPAPEVPDDVPVFDLSASPVFDDTPAPEQPDIAPTDDAATTFVPRDEASSELLDLQLPIYDLSIEELPIEEPPAEESPIETVQAEAPITSAAPADLPPVEGSRVEAAAALPVPDPQPPAPVTMPPHTAPAPPVVTVSDIDLSPVANQLVAGWQQGMRLLTLVAQVAPRYPGVPAHVLRGAIRDHLARHALPAAVIPPVPAAPAQDAPPPTQGAPPAEEEPVGASQDAPNGLSLDTDPGERSARLYGARANGYGQEEAHQDAPNDLSLDTPPAPLLDTSVPTGRPVPDPSSFRFFLIPEVAEMLGVTPKTVQRWLEERKVAYRLDERKRRCIPESEVERMRLMTAHH